MKKYGWFALAVAIAAILLLVVFKQPFGPLKFRQNMAEAGAGVAAALFVVTLFVERSIAAIDALINGDAKRSAEAGYLASPTDPEATTALSKALADSEKLRLLLSFISGIFISAAGIRTLAGLVEAVPACVIAGGKADCAGQPQLFFSVDVLLTAGLITGGSNALALLIQLLKELGTGSLSPEARRRIRLTTTT
jgi:hypothetical protein